eukprot:PhF_6_TR41306/c0_g1_i1/m.62548
MDPRSVCAWCLEDITASKGGCVKLDCPHGLCLHCAQTLSNQPRVKSVELWTCPLCSTHIKLYVLNEKIDVQQRVVKAASAATTPGTASTTTAAGDEKSPTAKQPKGTTTTTPAAAPTQETKYPCDFCDAESIATGCGVCENGCGTVCTSCQTTTHAKGKFKTHNVTQMTVAIAKQNERKLGVCKQHNKALDVYCFDCEDFTCMMCCQFGIHSAHLAKPLSDSIQEVQRQLQSSVAKASTYQKHLEDGKKSVTKMVELAGTELEKQKKSVETHFTQLAKLLEERKKNILTELESVHKHKVNVLETQLQTLSEEHNIVQIGINYVTARKDKIPSFQIVPERIMLTTRLDSQSTMTVPVMPKEDGSYACFMEKGAEEDIKHITKSGLIDPSPKSTGELFTYSYDFDTNGILYWFGRKHGTVPEYTNPAALGLITVSTNGVEYGDVFHAVGHPKHQPKYATFSTTNEPGSWLCLHFGTEYVVCPTMYTLRNCASTVGHSVLNWVMEGSNDGMEWVEISVHTNDAQLSPDRGSTATFKVTGSVPRAFSRIRIRTTGPNRYQSPNAVFHYLMLSGLELYGFVAKSNFRKV